MSTTGKQERVLQSLDGVEKIPAPDFFYTRLKARMGNEMGSEKPVLFPVRPAFLVACMAVLLILNVAVLLSRQQPAQTFNTRNNTSSIENFANDYNLVGSGQLYE